MKLDLRCPGCPNHCSLKAPSCVIGMQNADNIPKELLQDCEEPREKEQKEE